MIAYIVFVILGSLAVFAILIICVRVAVYFEETCPFCVKKQKEKVRNKLMRRMLFPNEPDVEIPRPPSPSEDFITADLVCKPYIYEDAYAIGLTGMDRTMEYGRPTAKSDNETHPDNESVSVNMSLPSF